jgi:hypothetical protein
MKTPLKRLSWSKIFLVISLAFLVLSIVLSIASLFPIATYKTQKVMVVDDNFRLSKNEVYRKGLGAFQEKDNITLIVSTSTAFIKNVSVITSGGTNYTSYSSQNLTYSFTPGAYYYEAVFCSNSSNASWVHLQVTVEKPQENFPLSWLTTPGKIIFLLSLGAIMVTITKVAYSKLTQKPEKTIDSTRKVRTFQNSLLVILVLSLILWLVYTILNSNPYGTFENWYTDHLRHAYVSSLFLKDGLSVFSQPLGVLASQDSSRFMFVTWPEMPHLYPLGSILLFLPFGVLLQEGINAILVYKLEIILFLIFAHICLFIFLRKFFVKNVHLFLKLVGLYIIYVTLVVYAADGMFDSVAFVFSLFAVIMFLNERYDIFFLSIGVSVFLKYQAGIFLFPLIIVGLLKLFEMKKPNQLIHNKPFVLGTAFVGISCFTGYLSAPFLIRTRPELIMNGINAFSSHSQSSWPPQAFFVLLTLAVTVGFAVYMLNKNSLLSLSSLFLLLPIFTLPYFQNWYFPFIFVYVLIPQQRKELTVTMFWLIFIVFMLSFGGVGFNPQPILNFVGNLLRI